MITKLKLKSEFSRNVLTLMTGTTIAQAIPIAISPILTRIYTPEDFGVFALYMSIVSMVSVIVTGRYELAIVLPEKDTEAANIFILSLIITIIITIFSFISIMLFKDAIISLLNLQNISNWLYLIPVAILLSGINQSFNYWNTRKKDYKFITKNKIMRSLVTGTSNISFGVTSYNSWGLIVGSFFGQVVTTFNFTKKFVQNDQFLISEVTIKKIIVLAKKYRKFPLINLLHAFLNISKENLVNIFISLKYSQSTLGYYFFMLRMMKLPSGILGSSLAQVFYKEASVRYNKNNNIQKLVLQLIKKLALIACIPIVVLYFYANDIFGFIFGKEWIIAGHYAQAIAPYIYFHFIASPLGMVPLIVNKQEKSFFWGVFESVLFIFIFIFAYIFFKDLIVTLNILSIVMPIYFVFYFKWIYKISGAYNA